MSSTPSIAAKPRLAPKWAVIYAGFTVVLITAFTITGYVQPDLLLGTWAGLDGPGSTDLNGPLGFWMARNVAFIALGVAAFALRSRDLIIGVLIFRTFADLFDFIHTAVLTGQITSGFIPLAMAIIAAVGAALMLRHRSKGN